MSCSEMAADIARWNVNFSSARNWGDGSTFPVVPLRFVHSIFVSTCLAHWSVKFKGPPYSSKAFGSFALMTPFATLRICFLFITPPAALVPIAVFNFFDQIFTKDIRSSSLVENGFVLRFSFPGVNSCSIECIFLILRRKLFDCRCSPINICVRPYFFLYFFRYTFLVFVRTTTRFLYFIFHKSYLSFGYIICSRFDNIGDPNITVFRIWNFFLFF